MPPGPRRPPRTDQGPPGQSMPPARSPAPRRDRGNRPGPTATPAAASRTQTTARTADGTGASPAPGPAASDRQDHTQSTIRLNNISERGVRPLKTQQKISGRLTSEDATRDRLDIRSYLDTARKHGQDVMTVLRTVMTGTPWSPPVPAAASP